MSNLRDTVNEGLPLFLSRNENLIKTRELISSDIIKRSTFKVLEYIVIICGRIDEVFVFTYVNNVRLGKNSNFDPFLRLSGYRKSNCDFFCYLVFDSMNFSFVNIKKNSGLNIVNKIHQYKGIKSQLKNKIKEIKVFNRIKIPD